MATELKISINVASVNRLNEELRRRAETIVEVGQVSLSDLAEDIKKESYNQCPKGTETLARSSYVEVVQQNGTEVTVRIGYGGSADKQNPVTGKMASTYMVPVHERLDVRHPVGKAKFLEDPVREAARDLAAKLAQELGKALGG